MEKIEPVTAELNEIQYVRGWSYQDQLGSLDTHAPHVLPSKQTLPSGVTQVREMELTRAGFIPNADHRASYLYRANPGPGWVRDGAKAISSEQIAPRWVTGRFAEPAPPEETIPRKYRAESNQTTHVLQSLTSLFFNKDVSVGICTGNQPMPFFFRNADGDDLFYVHQGSGVCETELGLLGYEAGHYVWIPKGVAYRLVPLSSEHQLLHVELYGESFGKPDTSLTGDAAVYYHRNIEVPKAKYVDRKGSFPLILKSHGTFTQYTFPFHPMDVIGWDGTLFPFRLHIKHVHPITSWRAHIPPSAYCTFCGSGFEICSFVPRPVETGERSLPVPFDHINIDRDEVLFYSSGTFFSKNESMEGSLTFHPRGFAHGPHPSALSRAMERREKDGAYQFEGYSIMVETFASLYPTKFAATLEDKSYLNSWL